MAAADCGPSQWARGRLCQLAALVVARAAAADSPARRATPSSNATGVIAKDRLPWLLVLGKLLARSALPG